MNIIKEGLQDNKAMYNLLDDAINGKELISRYFALKIISIIAGKKGFEADKIATLLPLIKVIE
jgi:Fic family protein